MGRALLVKRVEIEGWRTAEAASAGGVSIRTAYKWLALRAGGERMRVAYRLDVGDRSPALRLVHLHVGRLERVPFEGSVTHGDGAPGLTTALAHKFDAARFASNALG